MSQVQHKFVFLRVVLMAILALGLCLQPVFAAACEIADATQATEPTYGDDANATDAGQGECCPNQVCSDCCLHATATFDPARVALPSALDFVRVSAPYTGVTPSDYPVDIRPPIQA
ncbi:MAG: hypothetical protein ABI538_07525 [Pseudoxanthomonas sp.]